MTGACFHSVEDDRGSYRYARGGTDAAQGTLGHQDPAVTAR
jgi:hypothetical protein